LFWVYEEVAHHGRNVWQSKADHHMTRRQKRIRRVKGPTVFFKGTPSITWGFLTEPHLLMIPPPPSKTNLGTKPLTNEPLGDLEDAHYSNSCS
jgi:hypothetical protein